MKQTGKVKLLSGALIPNQRGLWYTCLEKLNEAILGIEQMKSAEDRISYESGWVRFIESLQESWSSFYEEGLSTSTKFQPWAGKFEKVRKSDELLRYLVQSRHQSQHGNIAMEWHSGSIQIAPGYFGHLKGLVINADGTFEVEANPLGKIHDRVQLKHDTGTPRLPVVVNRQHKQSYTPPETHLGKDITSLLPHELGTRAVDFYKGVYDSAIKKFSGLA